MQEGAQSQAAKRRGMETRNKAFIRKFHSEQVSRVATMLYHSQIVLFVRREPKTQCFGAFVADFVVFQNQVLELWTYEDCVERAQCTRNISSTTVNGSETNAF